MTRKRTGNMLALLTLLLVAAFVIWACNSAIQPPITPAAPEGAAPTPAVTAAGEPAVTSIAPAQEDAPAEPSGNDVPTNASADVRIFTIDQSQS